MIESRAVDHAREYRHSPGTHHLVALVFNRFFDPRAQLALLCTAAALVYWNNDQLFVTFTLMAFCSGFGGKPI